MRLLSLFKIKGRSEPLIEPQPEPKLPQKSIMELADEYVDFMGRYDRSALEVRGLSRRLGTLMGKHEIEYIARKDCLLRRRWSFSGQHYVEIESLPKRLNGHMEDAPAAHLIPLVDRLLEADGGYQRDRKHREELGGALAKAMKAESLKAFLHRGYRFEGGYSVVYVESVADFDG